eukprot:sb/3479193/
METALFVLLTSSKTSPAMCPTRCSCFLSSRNSGSNDNEYVGKLALKLSLLIGTGLTHQPRLVLSTRCSVWWCCLATAFLTPSSTARYTGVSVNGR